LIAVDPDWYPEIPGEARMLWSKRNSNRVRAS
jgi:hypothetical protein